MSFIPFRSYWTFSSFGADILLGLQPSDLSLFLFIDEWEMVGCLLSCDVCCRLVNGNSVDQALTNTVAMLTGCLLSSVASHFKTEYYYTNRSGYSKTDSSFKHKKRPVFTVTCHLVMVKNYICLALDLELRVARRLLEDDMDKLLPIKGHSIT